MSSSRVLPCVSLQDSQALVHTISTLCIQTLAVLFKLCLLMTSSLNISHQRITASSTFFKRGSGGVGTDVFSLVTSDRTEGKA